jgi:hypothetical protein
MDSNISFSSSIYLEQETREDEELSVFTRAVADVFSPQEARLSERDWLDEADTMDTPPLSTVRNWRAVSIAASFRLEADPGTLAHLLSDHDHRKRHDHFSQVANRR